MLCSWLASWKKWGLLSARVSFQTRGTSGSWCADRWHRPREPCGATRRGRAPWPDPGWRLGWIALLHRDDDALRAAQRPVPAHTAFRVHGGAARQPHPSRAGRAPGCGGRAWVVRPLTPVLGAALAAGVLSSLNLFHNARLPAHHAIAAIAVACAANATFSLGCSSGTTAASPCACYGRSWPGSLAALPRISGPRQVDLCQHDPRQRA